MLTMVSVDLKSPSLGTWPEFVEELSEFGWTPHPHLENTFFAEYSRDHAADELVPTICSEVGMCAKVTDAKSWSALVSFVS